MTEYITIRIPADLDETLGRMARRLDRSKSWVVREALKNYLPAKSSPPTPSLPVE